MPESTQGATLARLPLDALFALLGTVGLVGAGQKALLLAIVFLAGYGMHRLAPTPNAAGRLFAGVVYAVNPFVYDRLYAGQWFLLLGYALLPFALAAFVRLARAGARSAWSFALAAVAVGVASAHMFVLLLVACACVGAALVAASPGRRAGTAGALGCGAALAVAGSLYWLVPTPATHELWSRVGNEQLGYYATVGDERWGVEATVAALSGFWNDPDPIRELLPGWQLLALALVLLAAWGLVERRRDGVALGVAAAGLLGFLLALGVSSALTGSAFTLLLERVPAARSFREPQKGVALLALAYAYLGSAGVAALVRGVRSPARRRALAAVALAVPLLAGYRTFGGLWGTMQTSSFPPSWTEARRVLAAEAAGSRTLFLPWAAYVELWFAGGRLVANPAPQFFDSPMLASKAAAPGPGLSDTTDPVDARVARLLRGGARNPRLGACLAELGVAYVLLAREVGAEEYVYLDRRSDVAVVRRWPELVLYRLREPGGLAMAARGATPCRRAVDPLPVRRLSPVRYELERLPRAPARLLLGLPLAAEWSRDGLSLSFGPWRDYRRNYALGAVSAVVAAAVAAALARPRR